LNADASAGEVLVFENLVLRRIFGATYERREVTGRSRDNINMDPN
jgi:hypothetical protein